MTTSADQMAGGRGFGLACRFLYAQ